MQSGQPLIRRNTSQAGLRTDGAVDRAIFVSQAVIIAESEQGAKLKEDCTGFAGALHFILHDRRVLALNHENGLLDLNTLNFKREDGEWLEAELLEILEPFGMHNSLIVIRAQVKRPAIDEDGFFQLGKKRQASNRRL